MALGIFKANGRNFSRGRVDLMVVVAIYFIDMGAQVLTVGFREL